jgi:RNA polymerase II C-terminal domain phosphatase-like 3/4
VLNARGKRSLTVRAETLEAFHVLQTKKQLQRRKLVLVLDLDHTLIHAVPGDKRCHIVHCGEPAREYVVKVRPFVDDFLKAACALFDMQVYTFGSREYADAIVHLLDPTKVLFGDRVVSR